MHVMDECVDLYLLLPLSCELSSVTAESNTRVCSLLEAIESGYSERGDVSTSRLESLVHGARDGGARAHAPVVILIGSNTPKKSHCS